MDIVLQMPDIPVEAAMLMVKKTAQQAYDDMVDKRGIPRVELLTFSLVNGSIIANETKDIVAYVAVWLNDKASVCLVGEGDWLVLMGVEDADDPPLAGEWEEWALKLFLKYYEQSAAAKVNQ